MSHLAPHPWDAVAPPPPPGPDYRVERILHAVEYAEAARKADDLSYDADAARQEADEAESKADEALKEAETLRDLLAKTHPLLAKAIETDPERFADDAAVASWLRDQP